MYRKIFNSFFLIVMWVAILFIWLCTVIVSILKTKKRIKNKAAKHAKPTVVFLECLNAGNAGYVYRTTRWVEILNTFGMKTHDFNVSKKEIHQVNIKKPRTHFQFYTKYLFKRILQCFLALQYDIIIIRRDLLIYNDYGNLFLEKFLLAAHPYIIYDFDDNIGAVKNQGLTLSTYGKLLLERKDKFTVLLQMFSYYQPGNEYLNNMIAEQHAGKKYTSIVLPTLVDYNLKPPRTYDHIPETLTFGWIGGAYNLHLLKEIVPALNNLSKRYAVRLMIVCSHPFEDDRIEFENVFIPWALDKELEHIAQMDVGIMPLEDNSRDKGKCGFKLIQYMGHGVPGIGSSIGVNEQIIDDGVNGFLVTKEHNWEQVFEYVLTHKDMLPIWGAAAYEKINDAYSFTAYAQRYVNFLTSIIHAQ